MTYGSGIIHNSKFLGSLRKNTMNSNKTVISNKNVYYCVQESELVQEYHWDH